MQNAVMQKENPDQKKFKFLSSLGCKVPKKPCFLVPYFSTFQVKTREMINIECVLKILGGTLASAAHKIETKNVSTVLCKK